jgi:hypothetical protein
MNKYTRKTFEQKDIDGKIISTDSLYIIGIGEPNGDVNFAQGR